MDDHDRSERLDEKSAKPPAKPIDNKVLAAMLRESAAIVERGEFEPILYTALQDFRVYYKQHYPAKKNKHRSRSRSLTRTKEKKGNNSPSNANESSQEATGQPNPLLTVTNTFDENVEAETERQPSEEITEREVSGALDVMSTLDKHVDVMSTLDKHVDVLSTLDKHVDSIGPKARTGHEVFEPEPKIEPHIPDIAGIVTAIPLTNSIAGPPKPTEDHYSPGGTIQKASVNTLLGKLKFPKKIGVSLPNPAFVAASKKNAERAKEDLVAFNGPLAQQAESSRRRKTGIDDGASKERTTSTTNSVEPLTHSQPGERAQVVAAQRDEIQELTQTPQQSSSTVTGGTVTTTIPVTRATSAGDSTEASSSTATPEAAAAVKEGYGNPFQNIQEGGVQTMTQQPVAPLKPDFQRPANANSSLIANGWIEQQRRSKMRFVWKEVLASLVQGRKPGEETTLWIQREVINPNTLKKELEALHQIPVKLLESCSFLDYSTDNRFTLKLYNATEEFVFRCRTDSAAAKWVQVLKKQHEISRGVGSATFEEEKKGPENSSSSSRMTVNELRAICHGVGINTVGMERGQLEAAADEVRRRGTYFAPPPGAPRPIPIPPTTVPQQNPGPPSNAPHVPPEVSQASGSAMLSVSELRAICHGAGINTVGMERGQLERAAEEVRKRGTYFPPPNAHATPPPSGSAPPPPPHMPAAGGQGQPPAPSSHVPAAPQANATQERLSINELRAVCHGAGINTAGMERQQLERAAEEVRKRGTYFDRPSATPSANTAHHPPSTSVPEDTQREAARRRDEEEQNRQKMEEEHRRRMAEQEHQRRVAEQHAAEQQRRYAEQQAAWQKQQQEEEHRRRLAEQQAAEQRRRHEEAVRQQQQWQQQQWQKQQQWNQQYQPQQPPKQWTPNQAPPPQQPQWQQPQQQRPQQPQQQQQRPQPNQQQQQQANHSAASEKYAKMANQTDDEGQAIITRIKHDILIHWALQPPQLQMLRPIDVLVTTIHKVFPPALGVPAHDYFSKFKPVSAADVSDHGRPDEEGLKKAIRKIRFFLHPDKLPKDLNPEQAFMVKMLWDVTSDAWDEFEKNKADLDWIK